VANDFFSYMDGIYENTNCYAGAPYTVSHAVLIIGFGNENGQDYWLI
jgi:hypothetical protein